MPSKGFRGSHAYQRARHFPRGYPYSLLDQPVAARRPSQANLPGDRHHSRGDFVAEIHRGVLTTPRHSGIVTPGPRDARSDDRLRTGPGISRFRVRSFHERPGMTGIKNSPGIWPGLLLLLPSDRRRPFHFSVLNQSSTSFLTWSLAKP